MKRNPEHHKDIWVECLNCGLKQINTTSNYYGCKKCGYEYAKFVEDK